MSNKVNKKINKRKFDEEEDNLVKKSKVDLKGKSKHKVILHDDSEDDDNDDDDNDNEVGEEEEEEDDDEEDEENDDDNQEEEEEEEEEEVVVKPKLKKKVKAESSSKKSKKRDDDDVSDEGSGISEDELEEIDTSLIINSGRRTRGKKIDYTQFGADPEDEE